MTLLSGNSRNSSWLTCLAWLLLGPGAAFAQADAGLATVIRLDRVNDSCNTQGGWTNIIFEGDSSAPAGAVAHFADGPATEVVRIVRRRLQNGTMEYRTQVGGRESEHVLTFERTATGSCAQASVWLPSISDTVLINVSTAEPKWAYGRVAEHRAGTVILPNGMTSRVEVYAASRNGIRFDNLRDLEVYIDQNANGAIERYTAEQDGNALRLGEGVVEMFTLGGQHYQLNLVGDGARHLLIQTVEPRPAPFRGYRAPTIDGVDTKGRRRVFDPASLTVIEFWSTECPFSEAVRSQSIRLAEEIGRMGGQYISMSRETDSALVSRFLLDHPRGGVVLLGNEPGLKTWNPELATPLFYAIARDGTIVLRERGSGAARMVAIALGIDPSLLGTPPR